MKWYLYVFIVLFIDNMHEDIGCYPAEEAEDSFDNLLRKAQEQIRKRKLWPLVILYLF